MSGRGKSLISRKDSIFIRLGFEIDRCLDKKFDDVSQWKYLSTNTSALTYQSLKDEKQNQSSIQQDQSVRHLTEQCTALGYPVVL
jgi:hypothetical protein